jgi:GNAT superfamily N-acetyltransferase
MPEITYRPATEADLEPIVAIARRIWTMGMTKRLEDRFGVQGGKPWDEWVAEGMRSALATRLDTCLVAEIEGQVAGWACWTIDQARNQGQIGYNGVAPEFRGHGIGTTLVRMALDKLREAGLPLALVVTGLDDGHAPARRVYEKCGFEPLHQSVTYVMELK